MNVFDVLDQAAARFGDRGAVFCGERQLCTWSQLRERALRLAASLRRHAERGSRIAVASENRPEIVELMFAIWAAECVFVPINYKLHPREMADIVADSGASHVFASAKIAGALELDTKVEVIASDAYTARLATEPAALPDTAPADLAWLFYTSGTT